MKLMSGQCGRLEISLLCFSVLSPLVCFSEAAPAVSHFNFTSATDLLIKTLIINADRKTCSEPVSLQNMMHHASITSGKHL